MFSTPNKHGSVAEDGSFLPPTQDGEGRGKPGVWTKDVVGGTIEAKLAPPRGKLSDLLRPVKGTHVQDARLAAARAANPQPHPSSLPSTTNLAVHKKDIFDIVLERSKEEDLTGRIPIVVDAYVPTDADVASFKKHGYFMPAEPMVSKACCAQLRKDYERVFSGKNDFDATPPGTFFPARF